jgi:hypothetical protein
MPTFLALPGGSFTTMTGVRKRRLALMLFLLLFLQLVAASGAKAQDLRFLIFDPVPFDPAFPLGSSIDGAMFLPPMGSQTGRNPSLRSSLETHNSEQTHEDRDLQSDISSYQNAIDEIETIEGPFSTQLPQQRMGLAAALQANGEHEAAFSQLEMANHVTRVNHGLFSIEQIPILEQMIENLLQQGNFIAADEKHNYLMFLQHKNHDQFSPGLLPALNKFGEWNLFAFNTGPGAIANLPKEMKVDDLTFRIQRLMNAQHAYSTIIDIVTRNFGMSDPRLMEAEMRLVLTNYLFATSFIGNVESAMFNSPNANNAYYNNQRPMHPVSHMGYRYGREALERRRSYLLATSGSDPFELARVSLDIADWMLFFNKQRTQALSFYENTHAELSSELPPASLKELFDPEYPVVLPSFLYPAYSRKALGIPENQPIDYQGYIDLSFELTRQGRPASIQVLGKEGGNVEVVQDRLIRSLRRSQFRPRMDNFTGKIRAKDKVYARYHFAY